LPSFFFFNNNEQLISFLFVDKFRFMSFFNHFSNYLSNFYKIYYFRMWFKGVGYTLVTITDSLLQFFFAKNILVYIYIPETLIVKYIETQIFFVSINLSEIKKIMATFLLLRRHTIYELSGIFYPRHLITLKPGKIKIR
jgi:ribosomal protein L6P/L9E